MDGINLFFAKLHNMIKPNNFAEFAFRAIGLYLLVVLISGNEVTVKLKGISLMLVSIILILSEVGVNKK